MENLAGHKYIMHFNDWKGGKNELPCQILFIISKSLSSVTLALGINSVLWRDGEVTYGQFVNFNSYESNAILC